MSMIASGRLALGGLAVLAALSAGSAVAQDCEIAIGATGPFSGSASAWGLALKSATEFQAALANEAGGLKVGDRTCQVRVVAVDAQCSSAGGAAAANTLAGQGIQAAIGPVCSPETTGFKPVAQRNGQVIFSSSYASDVIGPDFPLTFHLQQGPRAWGPTMIDTALQEFGFKSVMVLGPNDQGGTDAGHKIAEMYQDRGIAATEEYYQRGTTNFAPLATRILNANPDSVEFGATPTADISQIVRQLTQAGYEGIYGGMGGIGIGPVADGAEGIENLKGYYWLELVPVEDPGAVRMREDFQRVMKSAPPENALFYTSAIAAEQLLRAVSIAGTAEDGQKIAKALRGMIPESAYFGKGGWRGRAEYGINQELAFPIGVGIIKDGQKIGVKRVEIPAED